MEKRPRRKTMPYLTRDRSGTAGFLNRNFANLVFEDSYGGYRTLWGRKALVYEI